ncbi:Piso0_001146 [Millerozyma farinosa CBS 7064]|uniref:Piso0_001146 protein n=1 Tax=Pichia sorbitophila (strain ATCC MYA-4447 / BCRC 22081 / CBS 7064 / NBRC 10061 / NRRL Y-12695) TaxID=559304 RepID=G8YSI4_PICSO|nr:Piso0_001146 [Millerozyma farinosa CBS 7064]CCE79107.1 Piso0_001146 [Millerozyma farinosa CBS 7064]
MSVPGQNSYYNGEGTGLAGGDHGNGQANSLASFYSTPSNDAIHHHPHAYLVPPPAKFKGPGFIDSNIVPPQQGQVSHEYYNEYQYVPNQSPNPNPSLGFGDQAVSPKVGQSNPHPYSNYNFFMYNGPPNGNRTHQPQYQHHLSNSSISSNNTTIHSRTSSTSTRPSYYDPRPEELSKPVKPRIATTYWEDENTVCYQVEARGILVSRREDTNFVNGTKLLNVAGMTRGKRDGILKTEKTKSVIKVGTMNLKGVWIPFERAAEIARNEGIDVLLYPLFVKDIKKFFQLKGCAMKNDGTIDHEEPTSLKSPPSSNIENHLGLDKVGVNYDDRIVQDVYLNQRAVPTTSLKNDT